MRTPSTLCWTCANAIGKCSWSDWTHKPVKGWIADKVPYHTAIGDTQVSYIVYRCPEFVADKRKPSNKRERLV